MDFSTRTNSSTARRGTQRDSRSSSPRRDRRSPSPRQSSDSPQPVRRDSPTYEPFHTEYQAAASFEDERELYGYSADTRPRLSEHERNLLERKYEHHDAFVARRERLEQEEELERRRKGIMKEKMASVQQEVAEERQAGTSQKRSNPMDSSRRKALLEKMVAKKVQPLRLQYRNKPIPSFPGGSVTLIFLRF